jgi:hypothetical protein
VCSVERAEVERLGVIGAEGRSEPRKLEDAGFIIVVDPGDA